jgi:hypothetical protein
VGVLHAAEPISLHSAVLAFERAITRRVDGDRHLAVGIILLKELVERVMVLEAGDLLRGAMRRLPGMRTVVPVLVRLLSHADLRRHV